MRRTVLVTGATSGIGLETALHLAGLGFDVIGSARDAEKAAILRQAAVGRGVDVDIVLLDLDDPDAGAGEIAGLDLWALVNNAGSMEIGAVEDVDPATARRLLEAMVVAPMRLARDALPAMRARGDGRIVNVGSSVSYASGAMIGWYQGAKHALAALSDALRAEVAGHGIDVVLIEPGGHRTAIWRAGERSIEHNRRGSVHADAYDQSLALLRRLEPLMPPPANVARVIGEALTAGRPRRRYRVGPDSWLLEAAEAVLPERVRDRALRTVLRL